MRPPSGSAAFRRALVLNLGCGIAIGAGLLAFTAGGLAWRPQGMLPALYGVAWTPRARTVAALRADGIHAMLAAMRALALVVVGVAGANLLFRTLDHTLARRAELQLRAALGASPRQALRWALGAWGAPVLGAAAAGCLCGWLLLELLLGSWPRGLGAWRSGPLDGESPAAAAGLTLLAFLCLAGPVLLGARRGLAAAFTVGAGVTAGPFQTLMRRALSRAQFTASMALAVCAALLLRATIREAAAPIGGSGTALTVGVTLPAGSAEARASELSALLRRIEAQHGIVAAGFGTQGAWSGEGPEEVVTAFCRPSCGEGGMPLPVLKRPARLAAVTPGYLALAGARQIQGRDFTLADQVGAESVAVVSRRAAYRLFPGQAAVGQHFTLGRTGIGTDGTLFRVVGVVEDLSVRGAPAAPGPLVYLSALQHPAPQGELLLRSAPSVDAGRPLTAAGVPGPPIPVDRAVRTLTAPARWSALVMAALAMATLGFCGYGLHGLAAAGMAARTREVGVRMALGATPGGVLRLAIGEAMRIAAVGTAIGFLMSIGVAGFLREAFHGIPWMDLRIAACAAALMGSVALAACWRPARRAASIEPREALTHA